MKLYAVSMHLHVHVTCLIIIIQVHCRLGLSLLRVTARGVAEDEFSLLCARFTSVVLVMLTTVGSVIGFWSMEEVDNVEFDGRGAVTTWSKMFKDQININIKYCATEKEKKKRKRKKNHTTSLLDKSLMDLLEKNVLSWQRGSYNLK